MNNKEVEDRRNKMRDKMAKEYGGLMIKEAEYKCKAIGYLCIREKYIVDKVPDGFIEKLYSVYHNDFVLGSMGHHECEFCINQGVKKLSNDATSSSEKMLRDKKNKIDYWFPEMIFHYIKVHMFKPSDEFIKFIMEYKDV